LGQANTLNAPKLAASVLSADFARLAEAVAAVGRLILDSGIPPAVEMEYVGGGLQVEALAAGSQ
jgi:hypothetical protein